MIVDGREQPHGQFIEDDDHPQRAYEAARKTALDRRCRVDDSLLRTLDAHGVAGLFIDPDAVLLATRPARATASSYRGTALHHSRLDEDEFAAIACSLAEAVGVNATARIQNVDKKTVLFVLARAAKHAASISRKLLTGIAVRECQLDEMWSFVGKKEMNLDPLEKLHGLLGDAWIWTAFDADSKVLIAHVVGKRTTPYAVDILAEVKRVTAHMPLLFSSDQLPQYEEALLQTYGEWVQPPRKPGPGRPPKPRLVPPDDLVYVQVVKRYRKYRVVGVDRKIVFGDPDSVEAILNSSNSSCTINTSFVERSNGTVRHIDARCSRKTYRFSKHWRNHVRQLDLSLAYYHLCRPHRSLTKRHGRKTTPFMAAGFTDHVWSMRELLTTRPEELRA